MENETIEKMFIGFKESIEELKRGNINIYSKIDSVMDKIGQHDTSIQLLNHKYNTHDESINRLLNSQKELYEAQSNMFEKMAKSNKQSLGLAISIGMIILVIIGMALRAAEL